jgi:mannose-6-phosphate isomerase
MIYNLIPSISRKIWGGEKLSQLKKIHSDNKEELPIGETWEISTHPEGASHIQNGALLDQNYDLSFLVKFLDTNDVLSIQVHPNDDYALKHEKQKGKTECWLILEAEKDGGIYLGLKPGISKSVLKTALKNDENIDQLLNYFNVKAGDFFYVPSGTIHAIGKGVTLIEVQQSSGVTYRVWDWKRKEKNGTYRALNIEKSLDVLNDNPIENNLECFRFSANNFTMKTERKTLMTHADFHFELISISPMEKMIINVNHQKPIGLVVLNSNVMLNKKELNSYHSYLLDNEFELSFYNSNRNMAYFALIY